MKFKESGLLFIARNSVVGRDYDTKNPTRQRKGAYRLSEYVLNSFKKEGKESGSFPGQQSRRPWVKGGRKTLKKFWPFERGSAAAGRKLQILKATERKRHVPSS